MVIIANGAFLLSLLTPYVEWYFFSDETIGLLNRTGHGALFMLPTGIQWLIVLLFLAIAVGLYCFSASARAAFVILLVGFGLTGLISGIEISSPVVGFLVWVTVMSDGAILALAYATPLKHRFV